MFSPQTNPSLPPLACNASPPEKTIRYEYQETLNLITVKGSSIGDHSGYKYDTLLDDVESHFKKINSLQLFFNYDFIDQSAVYYLKTIVAALNDYHQKGKMVKLFWSCSNTADDVSDPGEILKSRCRFEFHG